MEGRFSSQPADDGGPSTSQGPDNPPSSPTNSGTCDVMPRLDHYRASKRAKRPSLSDLHEGKISKDTADAENGAVTPTGPVHAGLKLGWIQGVLIPCLLNIWGVMLFLRLSWIVGQAGTFETICIIAISAVVCVVTTLSLSAICTNGEVRGGGIYFILSRSLGPEFGASVGLVFAFANAVSASMNTIGFCDSLNTLLQNNGLKIVDNGITDTRIIGCIALLLMILICAVGMEWESKAQNFLIAIIILAIFDFLVGTLLGPGGNEELVAKGFVGLSAEAFETNWNSNYRVYQGRPQNFVSIFAIFFPSVTGIQAGANISGDLKDAAKSIPIGTLLALLISMISYVTFVLFAGGAAIRDASNITYIGDHPVFIPCINNMTTSESLNYCQYGLQHDVSIMNIMSVWEGLIYAGCFAATLSTALTNLLSVPRLIQALGQDRIYPGLIFFSKGYGKAGEPYRGYVLTFIVSALFLLIGDLNSIAPLISNCYLASYALINFCTFHAALIRPLGWRPTFKYYNKWLSFLGFLFCGVIMFLIDWGTAFFTVLGILCLFFIVIYRKPKVNWGSSTQAQTYKTALTVVHQFNNMDEHVKNYSPQILALCGAPSARPDLLHLANLITKNNSLLVCGEVNGSNLSYRNRSSRLQSGYAWLQANRIKAFYHVVNDLSLEHGAAALMQATGIGKLAPNIVLMGYKASWDTRDPIDIEGYFNLLHNAFDQKLAVAMLRLPKGLDKTSSNNKSEDEQAMVHSSYDLAANSMMHANSDLSVSGGGMNRVQSVPSLGAPYPPTESSNHLSVDAANTGSLRPQRKRKKKRNADNQAANSSSINPPPKGPSIFQMKHKSGVIDVWWLYDDGGLTMLLPYIISTRSNWENCELRVFALTNQRQEAKDQEQEMAEILNKFRIKFNSLIIVDDISLKPQEATQDLFRRVVDQLRLNQPADFLPESEIQKFHDKTCRQLRLRELLLENSKQSSLVVMSLPMPRKGAVSAPLYMAWLEILTVSMPTTLLIRGNQSSVMTFYS